MTLFHLIYANFHKWKQDFFLSPPWRDGLDLAHGFVFFCIVVKTAFLLYLHTVVCQAGQWAAADFVLRATGAALIVTVKCFHCRQCLQDCKMHTLKDLGNICEWLWGFVLAVPACHAAMCSSSDRWREQNFLYCSSKVRRDLTMMCWRKTETAEKWLLKCFSDITVLYIVLCTEWEPHVPSYRWQIGNTYQSDLFWTTRGADAPLGLNSLGSQISTATLSPFTILLWLFDHLVVPFFHNPSVLHLKRCICFTRV